ncbi:hypothetical protein [Variovorax rhizosphaerae]|uniref:Nucleotide exchange factor GrpE n=1 Tax=Variovorax rhizosphaerae TaxID=1836200 RepID=A0ABU8WNF9_9BURK
MTASESSRTKPGDNEEPELTQEESIPSDGKDVEGEEMMKQVRNKKLAQPDEPADKAG